MTLDPRWLPIAALALLEAGRGLARSGSPLRTLQGTGPVIHWETVYRMPDGEVVHVSGFLPWGEDAKLVPLGSLEGREIEVVEVLAYLEFDIVASGGERFPPPNKIMGDYLGPIFAKAASYNKRIYAELYRYAPGYESHTSGETAALVKDWHAARVWISSYAGQKRTAVYTKPAGSRLRTVQKRPPMDVGKITKQDYRPRTRPGFYKRGKDYLRVDAVEPIGPRRHPGAPLGPSNWFVLYSGPLTSGTPSPSTPLAPGEMPVYELGQARWRRVDRTKVPKAFLDWFDAHPV